VSSQLLQRALKPLHTSALISARSTSPVAKRRLCAPSLRRGHTHIDDVAANAEAFQHCETLLLIHFSMRCARLWSGLLLKTEYVVIRGALH
jgi:ribonuclease BN (tRNA processing enzyme)